MGATNRAIDIDSAFRRRMPLSIFVELPNKENRKRILSLILKKGKIQDQIDVDDIANKTVDFSGSELYDLCRSAFMLPVQELHSKHMSNEPLDDIEVEQLRPLRNEDFNTALNKFKRSKQNMLYTF